MAKKDKIVLIGSHATPAASLIDQLHNSYEIHFIGRVHSTEGDKAYSLEYKLLSGRDDIIFHSLTSGRLQRTFTIHTIPSLLKIPKGFIQAFLLLVKIHPKLVISFGGYLSVPVVVCAYLLNIPIFIHEQTSVPGLSAKLTSRLAKKIFLTFSQSGKFFSDKKTIFSGNLLRKEIISPPQLEERSVLAKFLKINKDIIYVTGGGQGSKLINDFLINNLKGIVDLPYSYIFQTGELENSSAYVTLTDIVKALSPLQQKKILIAKHFSTKEVGNILKNKPIIFGRSGANTVCEAIYFRLRCIFVPLSIAAGSEQAVNARILHNAHIAEVINSADLNFDSFSRSIKSLKSLPEAADFSPLESQVKIDTKLTMANEINTFLRG